MHVRDTESETDPEPPGRGLWSRTDRGSGVSKGDRGAFGHERGGRERARRQWDEDAGSEIGHERLESSSQPCLVLLS
jgi:diadenosine tetraphosphatase ApaH/serine/threonine PP2A family protein phosphatase